MSDRTKGAVAPGVFRVGAVLSRAAGILSRNPLTFFILTLIPTLPNLLFFGGGKLGAHGAAAGAAVGMVIVLAVSLALMLGVICQAVVLYGAFQSMRGRPVRAGESAQKGLARIVPIIGLAICMVLAIAIGIVLLIVPGIIALTMFFVALPVCVVEQLGPIGSMKRSAELTKGHRWRILGIILLLTIANGIIGGVLQLLLGMIGGFAIAAIGALIWNALFGAYSSIVAVVGYHDLRVAKEGIGIERIAAVFN